MVLNFDIEKILQNTLDSQENKPMGHWSSRVCSNQISQLNYKWSGSNNNTSDTLCKELALWKRVMLGKVEVNRRPAVDGLSYIGNGYTIRKPENQVRDRLP